MVRPVSGSPPRPEGRAGLAGAGRRPWAPASGSGRPGGRAGPGCRLRAALQGRGTAARAFGAYLATRPDLLPARDCLELSALDDQAPPVSPAQLQDRLDAEAAERGGPGVVIDGEAILSRLMTQTHRARLGDGRSVLVKVAHTDRIHRAERALAALDLPDDEPAVGSRDAFRVRDAVDDFLAALGDRCKLSDEADALEALGRDEAGSDDLAATVVHRALGSATTLVVEPPVGFSLDAWLAGRLEQPDRDGAPDARTVARALAAAWLRQAFDGRVFPVEPAAADLVVLPEGKVAFTGGVFSGLAVDERADLGDYLVAVSAHQPDRAAASLLCGMEEEGRPVTAEALRRLFRQLTPLAEGGWDVLDPGDSLAEQVFVQWRAARRLGCRPRPSLLQVYRGLGAVALLAHRLAPEDDALLEALKAWRLRTALGSFAGWADWQRAGDGLGEFAAAAVALPDLFDQALLGPSGGARGPTLQAVPEAAAPARPFPAALFAVVLALAAAPRAAGLASAGSWADRAAAAALLVLGTALLRKL